MKTLTHQQLIKGDSVKLSRERTLAYAEGVKEPEEYQWVRDAYLKVCCDDQTKRSIEAFLEMNLKIPLTPPELERPGVGVVMVPKRGGRPFLILQIEKGTEPSILSQGKKIHVGNLIFYNDRPANPEEFNAFWGLEEASVTHQKGVDTLEDLQDEIISTKIKDQVEE